MKADELGGARAHLKDLTIPKKPEVITQVITPAEQNPPKRSIIHLNPAGPNEQLIQEAIADAEKYPVLGIWDPTIKATLRYLEYTTPRFEMSTMPKELIQQWLEQNHPVIYAKMKSHTFKKK